MPTLHNPAENSLFCHRLGRIIGINERVEITDEEAADLVGGAVFVVEGYEAPEGEPAADAEESDESDESEAADEPSATPRRASAKRGSKQVEVTEAPNVEKRG